MSADGKVNPVVDVVFPAVITFSLFTSVFYLPKIPVVGRYLAFFEMVSLFSPLPLIYTSLKKNRTAGVFALTAVLIALVVLMDIRYGLIFFVEYGIVAVIIAESIKRNFPVEKTILYCVLGSLISGAVILLTSLLFRSGNPYVFLIEQMKASLDNSLEHYQSLGAGGNVSIEDVRETIEHLKKITVRIFPALLIIGLIIGSIVNYFTAQYLWLKYIARESSPKRSFSQWILPDYVVWTFIVPGFLLVFPGIGVVRNVSLNLFILVSLIYFLQGMSVTVFFYRKLQVSPVFRRLVLPLFIFLIILTAGPFVALVITGVGLFDTWVDFRKIRPKTQAQ